MKALKKIILHTLLFVFAAASSVLFAQENIEQNQNDPNKWRQDLQYMHEQMPKWHKNLFHTISKSQFDESVKKLDREIPSLSRHQIITEMARIVASIGDGHTNIAPTRDPKLGFRTYPLKLYFFSDGLYVRAATHENAGLVGARVLRIGNVSVEDAYNAVSQLIGRDNEMGVKFFAPFLLAMPEVLHALGLITDMEKGTYTVEVQGHQKTITVQPFGPAEMLAPDTDTSWMLTDEWIDARKNSQTPAPLWLRDPLNKFWFEYLNDSQTLYVQFNKVGDKENETVAEFSKRIFEFVDKNPIERFVLDLRLNRGGNGQLNKPLLLSIIKSLKIDEKGKLFAIIGRSTWSAAQFLVDDLDKYTNVIFVGEPTGGKPNSYGDSRKIVLPNSGITVRVSTLWWQGDERDTRQWIAPGITAELSFKDYSSNIDPALNAILNYVPQKSLTDLLSEAITDGGVEAASARFKEWKSNPANKYVRIEQELNSLGYKLIAAKQIIEAVAIFKFNTEAYPESANAYDSLGEAYLLADQKQLSIQSYKKSLELNPNNTNAKEVLKKLQ